MTEIHVDETLDRADILPIISNILQGGIFTSDLQEGILQFYVSLKQKCFLNEIRFGTSRPNIGLRNLVRSLKYMKTAHGIYGLTRSLLDALVLGFTTQVDEDSKKKIVSMI